MAAKNPDPLTISIDGHVCRLIDAGGSFPDADVRLVPTPEVARILCDSVCTGRALQVTLAGTTLPCVARGYYPKQDGTAEAWLQATERRLVPA